MNKRPPQPTAHDNDQQGQRDTWQTSRERAPKHRVAELISAALALSRSFTAVVMLTCMSLPQAMLNLINMSQRVSIPYSLLALALYISACSMTGLTVMPSGAPEYEIKADQGNLAAIKTLLAREREQFGRLESPSPGNAVEPLTQEKHRASTLMNGSVAASSIEITSTFPHGLFLIPTPTTGHHQVPQVQRMPTQRSSSNYQMHPSTLVPPFTNYASVGSVYPGTIRCLPDSLGGQRCHNTP